MEAKQDVDLLIVGGGINGAGIARDAAGRGLSVLLCEQHDLANHTSSASSKLIHGGLRYLEHYEFRLVGKALAEREVLLRAAPHIIWPLRFVMPHEANLRPAWLIRLGLFLYDWLDFGKRKLLPGSQGIDLRRHPAGKPLQARLTKGFEYSDCWVQDARLVVLNALDAAERGAIILTRTRCIAARREGDRWLATLEQDGGARLQVRARALVNAAGPWVARFLDDTLKLPRRHAMRLVKGSHIVVPRLFEHAYAYIFQNPDKRIVFALPYEGQYTLIGTTDVMYSGDPARVAISPEETQYLCDTVNRYFQSTTRPEHVVYSYAGIRPLLEDEAGTAAAVTRDYSLDLDTQGPPLLSIFGGKITTFRKLAEEAMDQLAPLLGNRHGAWTGRDAPLPGGDIRNADFASYLAEFHRRYPWLPEGLAWRLVRNYGTRAERILAGAESLAGLGEHLGDGLYQAEVEYLIRYEWARTAEDILWRRSKLGLHVRPDTVRRLQDWLAGAALSA
ncbi:MAG TPA: glycerol-3-phosphate dehydrogenase [Candidatus Competibacteraceae bacterium]|nr:glycerol-3-phosphate dehydrogenase [Candidatus Competibacteraceae bacterium]